MPKNRTSACGRMLERVLPPNVPAGVMCRLMAYSLALGALVAAVDFATIVVVLLWLYMSGQVLILGAELSASLIHRKKHAAPSSGGEEEA